MPSAAHTPPAGSAKRLAVAPPEVIDLRSFCAPLASHPTHSALARPPVSSHASGSNSTAGSSDTLRTATRRDDRPCNAPGRTKEWGERKRGAREIAIRHARTRWYNCSVRRIGVTTRCRSRRLSLVRSEAGAFLFLSRAANSCRPSPSDCDGARTLAPCGGETPPSLWTSYHMSVGCFLPLPFAACCPPPPVAACMLNFMPLDNSRADLWPERSLFAPLN